MSRSLLAALIMAFGLPSTVSFTNFKAHITNHPSTLHSRRSIEPRPVLRDVNDFDTKPDDDGFGNHHNLQKNFDIHDMLTQRSIQTFQHYLIEGRNNVKAEWLRNFMNHSHLDTGKQWHGIVGLNIPFTSYLRHMILEPPSKITVECSLGTPENVLRKQAADGEEKPSTPLPTALSNNEDSPQKDTTPTPIPSVSPRKRRKRSLSKNNQPRRRRTAVVTRAVNSDLGAHPDLLEWQAAAESRRRNPYLQQKKSVEYTVDIVPKDVARDLMAICSQLATEWCEDLQLMASCDSGACRVEELGHARAHARFCLDNPDEDVCQVDYDDLKVPIFEAVERGRDGSSPLRRLNYELLQRISTIMAIKKLQMELSFNAMSERQALMELEWFDRFVHEWLYDISLVTPAGDTHDTDVGLNKVSDRFFSALEHKSPIFSSDGVIDPMSLADRLYQHREQSSMLLVKQLKETSTIFENIKNECAQREMLERIVQMSGSGPSQ